MVIITTLTTTIKSRNIIEKIVEPNPVFANVITTHPPWVSEKLMKTAQSACMLLPLNSQHPGMPGEDHSGSQEVITKELRFGACRGLGELVLEPQGTRKSDFTWHGLRIAENVLSLELGLGFDYKVLRLMLLAAGEMAQWDRDLASQTSGPEFTSQSLHKNQEWLDVCNPNLGGQRQTDPGQLT